MRKFFLFYSFIFSCSSIVAQIQDTLGTQLQEVVVESGRIDLPLSQNSRALQIISASTIKNSGLNSVAELLQNYAGVDIRQRGVAGMQADLYIRGGSFDQTLLLIDGIKVEDSQTGHHTLNFALAVEVIERIEIIKGPAARIFGQNAFTGAVNIVTKKTLDNTAVLGLQTGSYEQVRAQATVGTSTIKNSVIAHYSNHSSSGYRYNTDFKNQNSFVKAQFGNDKKAPLELIGSFSTRDFGANGFYASPEATDQYEATQASLLALSIQYKGTNWKLTPRFYWRRNQDEYIYIRNNPSIYRNLHLTHKVGLATDASISSKLGITGLGVDLARVSIASNNLGNRQRFMATLFAEHRFYLKDNTIDITPGVAVNYYSDFKWHAFPGIDLGIQLSDRWRAFGNIGYTYRIPTYTDLYYSDHTTIGNAALQPEEALAQEVGFRYQQPKVTTSLVLFNRKAQNLIDYVKATEDALWEATNIRELITQGVEWEINYRYQLGKRLQSLRLSYTYLNDKVQDIASTFSRYSINSFRHHFTGILQGKMAKNLSHSLRYKLGQRPLSAAYHVVDFSLQWELGALQWSLSANNIFNASYSETNLVPMPKGNGMVGVLYRLR